MAIKSVILRALAMLLSAVMLLTVAGNSNTKEYDVKEPDSCLLNFSILSDVHIEGNNNTRYKVFAQSLQNVKKNKSGNDAVVFLGDNTMNGNNTEHMLFCGTVARVLGDQKSLVALGNHDIGNGEGDYAQLQSRWYDYTAAFFDKKLTTPYYYDVIDGYYFIVLGMESHDSNTMKMSDDQLAWLGFTLEDAARSGKPVFVFSHHPSSYASTLNRDSEYDLIDMLSEYSETHDLFYFCGHTHRTLSRSSFREWNGYPETYLPRETELTGEKDNQIYSGTGFGVEVEVYENEVLIRGRNFYTGQWAESGGDALEASYALKNPVAE